jgi:pilus assembly protein FimV
MIVTCQNCDAHFSLSDALVKKTGSKVRCSKCKYVFVIFPEDASGLEMLSTDAGSESPSRSQGSHDREDMSRSEGQPKMSDTLDGEAIAGGDLDLSEIEKMLATDGPGEWDDLDFAEKPDSKIVKEEPLAAEPSTVSMGALDLSEIEKIFDMDQDLDDADRLLESEPEELLFDLDESSAHTKAPQKELGDFDIADIEKMLEEEMVESETDETGGLLFTPNPSPSPPSFTDEKTEEAEEPFSFTDIDALMEPDTAAGGDADEGDEGLTLEMDDDFKPAASSSAPQVVPEIEELDFSDLEGMMETNAQVSEDEAGGDAEEELTLALDSDDRVEIPGDDESSGTPDLSMLDNLLKEKEPEASGELALELDIADIAPASSASADADELELRFDETDMEDEAVADTTDAMDSDLPTETEEMDLKFDAEALDEELTATEEIVSSAEQTMDEDDEVYEKPQQETVLAGPVAPGTQPSGARKPMVLVLVLVVVMVTVVGGALFYGDKAVSFLSEKGIEIPFLSKLNKPAVVDTGNLKITTINIDSQFVENSAAGRIFVISGKARNGYGGSRSLIRITGKLYSKGKQLVNTETVYCGNVMTSQELSTLSPDEIKKRLGNQHGDNDANMNIKPGEDRPFMVVFSKLPENLEEFTLEVAGSQAAAQPAQK